MKNKYESPLKAFIDLSAFRNNINLIKKRFPKAKIILPVKANAYGHDSLIISKEAEKIGINYLAVARASEAVALRENKIKLPIINLGVETGENIAVALKNKTELSASSLDNIKEIEKFSIKLKEISDIHLKIDVGMRRLGCNFNECLALAEYISKSKNLNLKSVYTHFPKSESDKKMTQTQSNLFFTFKKTLDDKKIFAEFYHLFNSGAILYPPEIPEVKNFAIRPGILSYGYTPENNNRKDYGFTPVLTLASKVLNIKKVPKGSGISYGYSFKTKKETYLAAIALGYGDGFPRSLSNKFHANINGKNYPQRGTISMDLTVIEVDEKVKQGDTVFIFGDKSKCPNDAKDVAKKIKTISYEITTALTSRVAREKK